MRFSWFLIAFSLLVAGCGPSGYTADEQAYLDAEQILVRTVEGEGARPALELFRAMMDEDPRLAAQCHPLAHAVGRSAYRRYGFAKAFGFEDDICGSGYLHGIVETHFLSLPDAEVAAKTLCEKDAADCFH